MKVRSAFTALREQFPEWQVIDAQKEPAEIHVNIWAVAEQSIASGMFALLYGCLQCASSLHRVTFHTASMRVRVRATVGSNPIAELNFRSS